MLMPQPRYSNSRIWARRVLTVLAAMALGTGVAYLIGRSLQLRAGKAELLRYAERLVQAGDAFGDEDAAAIQAVLHDGAPVCSDADIAFMRDYVFRSSHIRDIGRTVGEKLVCSSGVGRLSPPRWVQAPDIDSGGTKIFIDSPVQFSPKTTGFIVASQGVSLVLNPATISQLEEPPRSYAAFLHDRERGRLKQTHGPAIPLSMAEILAGNAVERAGVEYQPLCSARSMVCQVAMEPREKMLQVGRTLVAGLLVGGALLGGALGLIAILAYRVRRSLEQQLRRAVRQESLAVVYQPIVEMTTRRIVGCEALVRWNDESGRPVRPDVFIELAEEKGFLTSITRLVVKTAMRELRELLRAGGFRVTVNIAAQDLEDGGFLQYLEDRLEQEKLPTQSVGLELTERSTADRATAMEAIAELSRRGHAVYIDDFGTGYSSLAYLHRLAVDAIKIDRSFTQTVGTEAVTASVVPQILAMAAQLELVVVVEGIETAEQAEYFAGTEGVRVLGQGWFFGRPMTAAKLKERMTAGVSSPRQ